MDFGPPIYLGGSKIQNSELSARTPWYPFSLNKRGRTCSRYSKKANALGNYFFLNPPVTPDTDPHLDPDKIEEIKIWNLLRSF